MKYTTRAWKAAKTTTTGATTWRSTIMVPAAILTAAALISKTTAFSSRWCTTRLPAASAFIPRPQSTSTQQYRSFVTSPHFQIGPSGTTEPQQRLFIYKTRLYHSSPLRKRDDEEGRFLNKVKNAAKKFLPAQWFQSDEEKRAVAERKRVEKAVKSEIQQVFKDAPLPLRVLGGMVSPLLGGMLSNLAETAASQQELIDVAYQKAVACITADAAVEEALGAPVTVDRPFSQSSSTSSNNGDTSTRVELAFPVSGSRRQGVGRLVSAGKGINSNLQLLEVQINGRVISVSTTPSSKKAKFGIGNDDNIIEAEIIEKDVKKF